MASWFVEMFFPMVLKMTSMAFSEQVDRELPDSTA